MSNPNPNPPPAPPQPAPAVSGRVAAAVALLTAGATVIGSLTGVLPSAISAFKAKDSSTSQITAIDQRLKLVEEAGPQIEALEKTPRELAEDMRERIRDAERSGEDVRDLKLRQRDLEL